MSTSALVRQDWVVTSQHHLGLAVGDFVEATADPLEDIWMGSIRGTVRGIYMAKSAPYATIDIGDDTTWDVNLDQIKVQSGHRALTIGWWQQGPPPNDPTNEHFIRYCMPIGLLNLPLGYIEVRIGHAEAALLVPPSCARLRVVRFSFTREGEITWDANAALFGDIPQNFDKPKPTEARIELVYPDKEPWGWDDPFPLQLCRANNKVYVCVGDLESLPDVEDMTA